MNIFQFPALTAFHFRRFYNHPEDPDRFSLDGSAHFSSQLRHIQHLRLTGRVGPTEQIISFLRRISALTILSLDIFVDYTMLLPVLFPPGAVSSLPNLTKLDLHLEGLELAFPRGPLCDIIEITKNGNMFRRMRKITLDTSQPCIFRFREMVESSKSRSLRDTCFVSAALHVKNLSASYENSFAHRPWPLCLRRRTCHQDMFRIGI